MKSTADQLANRLYTFAALAAVAIILTIILANCLDGFKPG